MAKLEVHIEAVQWTPGLEPVNIHYCGLGIAKGPLSKSSICSTTQTELSTRSGTPDKWGDEEVIAVLEQELAESGITAAVKLPEPPVVEEDGGGVIPPPEPQG